MKKNKLLIVCSLALIAPALNASSFDNSAPTINIAQFAKENLLETTLENVYQQNNNIRNGNTYKNNTYNCEVYANPQNATLVDFQFNSNNELSIVVVYNKQSGQKIEEYSISKEKPYNYTGKIFEKGTKNYNKVAYIPPSYKALDIYHNYGAYSLRTEIQLRDETYSSVSQTKYSFETKDVIYSFNYSQGYGSHIFSPRGKNCPISESEAQKISDKSLETAKELLKKYPYDSNKTFDGMMRLYNKLKAQNKK